VHLKNKRDQVKCELKSSRWIDTNKYGKRKEKIKGGLIVTLVAPRCWAVQTKKNSWKGSRKPKEGWLIFWAPNRIAEREKGCERKLCWSEKRLVPCSEEGKSSSNGLESTGRGTSATNTMLVHGRKWSKD